MSGGPFTPGSTSPDSAPPPRQQFPSRIPVVNSLPLRRWHSVRERKSSDSFLLSPTSSVLQWPKSASTDVNRNSIYCRDLHPTPVTVGKAGKSVLRRGRSFIERGEIGKVDGGGGGVARVATAASGRRSSTTESRRPGGPAGPPSRDVTPHTSPRIRSLSLSTTKTQSTTPARSPASEVVPSPRTPPSSPEGRHRSVRDWDIDSVASTASNISLASCDHATVARNGTTFSGRSMKYVVHCSEHSGAGEDYLTPTQRAHRQVKRLKLLLQQAQKELEQKDSEILKLTKEVVELRLYKAALSSPEERSTSSDAVTVKESASDQPTPVADLRNGPGSSGADLSSSCADSGHFEDFTNSSVHSKDSVSGGEEPGEKLKDRVETADKSILADLGPKDRDSEHNRLMVEYERRIQELVRTHEEDCYQMKQKHNDKVEELLQRLSEINARYWELVPDLEAARERIKELEQQLEEACKKLEEQEHKQKETYLKMYSQGQEAAKLEQEKQITELASKKPSRLSVPELLHQLQITQKELENVKDLEYASSSKQPLLSAKEAVALWVLGARKAMYRQLVQAKSSASKIDPEITLQFLKSAIYYFLTDKENNQGHLRAIQSILGFTESEISNIDKARNS